MKHEADFSTTVCGIPCGVLIESFTHKAPDHTSWASPDDYYGYTDCEWILLDRKGYTAEWLENKMSKNDVESLEIEIFEHFTDERERNYG